MERIRLVVNNRRHWRLPRHQHLSWRRWTFEWIVLALANTMVAAAILVTFAAWLFF